MATPEIAMYRGDNHTVKIHVVDKTGADKNITGARIKFTAVTLPTSVAKDSNNGITEVSLVTPLEGRAEIYILPADTKGTTPKEIGSYEFDVEITLSSKVQTVLKGMFKLSADVT